MYYKSESTVTQNKCVKLTKTLIQSNMVLEVLLSDQKGGIIKTASPNKPKSQELQEGHPVWLDSPCIQQGSPDTRHDEERKVVRAIKW